MLKNYLKIAFRNLVKNKSLSAINILGLAVSIAVCFLITLFILHELSYDKFHDNYENLYRTIIKGEITGNPIEYAVSMIPLSGVLTNDFEEVEAAVGIFRSGDKRLISYDDKAFYETSFYSATEEFFKVFDFELLRGDKAQVLSNPNSIVLTESLAKKYFGLEDPIGKTIVENETVEYTVTGVCRDFHTNSHLKMNAITSVEYTEDIAEYWGSFSAHNYIRLKEGVDPFEFETKINNLAMEKMGITKEQTGMEFLLFLEPVKDIHLLSNYQYNLGNDGDITYVYVFSIIALFILIIAYINFINLTTAHHMIRAKEIGVRKIVGANRKKLISQFLIESIVITLISTIVAFGLIELLQPIFNKLIGIELGLNFILHGKYLLFGMGFMIFMAIISGMYPAVYLSSLNPISVVKGNLTGGSKKSILRNVLVVFQFVISIALICSTGVIYKQLQFFQHKKLGFDKEHVLILPLRSDETRKQAEVLRDKLAGMSGVATACISSNYPGAGASQGHGFFPEGKSEEQPWLMKTMNADDNFVKTFKLNILQGRDFDAANKAEDMNVLINETLVKEVGWEDPVGKTFLDPFIRDGETMLPITVVGVLEDFHVNALRDKIEPMVIYYNPPNRNYLSLRLEAGNVFKVMDIVESEWKEMHPGMPFDYFFLDEHFDRIHRTERNLATTFMYFTILAIMIACLGLFGLASYATDRRIKEIGVRKVLGSTVGQIVLLLSKDFSKLVILANILAWPIAWYAMNKWLQNFAYPAKMDIWIFIFSGVIAFLIALITVSFRTVKAANSNPVKALKYE
ncbi:MAG: ABC transporter permease [Candidatus Cloacimonetes bacterium]|nr:ABC transporter permease [Candidatus Cloacimonadota bacterium]MCF7869300.1 ABC transporter permease [Candidatus Cloacimonadota bacterium]MCF7884722.1 ABC transporter permease [Candidatus Cloacimonadota bacterium]